MQALTGDRDAGRAVEPDLDLGIDDGGCRGRMAAALGGAAGVVTSVPGGGSCARAPYGRRCQHGSDAKTPTIQRRCRQRRSVATTKM